MTDLKNTIARCLWSELEHPNSYDEAEESAHIHDAQNFVFVNKLADAVIAVMPEPVGVKVKLLEWVDRQHEFEDDPNLFGIICEAKTSFPGDGNYIIYNEDAEENVDGTLSNASVIEDEGKFYFEGGKYFGRLDEAKAAAQADYDRRILSTLAPAPMSVEEGLTELEVTEVGNVGNYYGGLSIRCTNGKPEWSIENWDGDNWEDCPLPVFIALQALTGETP